MSKYTMELRKICDIYSREEVEKWFTDYNLEDYLTPSQLEKVQSLNIWSKEKLSRKIVDHYFVREIGFETPALFRHYAKVKMQEIMEEQALIIYSNSLEYNPLESVNFDITEERESEGNAKGNSISNSTNSANGLAINNDTPQGNINKQDINNGAYATNVNQSDTNSEINDNTNSNSESKSKEIFKHKEIGNKGISDSYQKMVMTFRQTINTVDKNIIEKLNVLFMGLY